MNKYILLLLLLSFFTNLFSHGGNTDEKFVSKNQTFFNEDDNFKEIVIEMTNWDFSIDYIELKKGKNYRLTFISKGGHHGINIPELGYRSSNLKLDESSSFDIHVDVEGEYKFFCYTPCGKGHKDMVGKIVIIN